MKHDRMKNFMRALLAAMILAMSAAGTNPAAAQDDAPAMEDRIGELGIRRNMLPSPERLAALESNTDDHSVYMLNLLKFYPDGGQAEYMKYGLAAQKRLAEVGASVLFMSQALPTRDGSKPYDVIAIVDYPTRKGLRELEESDEYRAALVHRDKGLDHQILYALNAETPRSMTGGERVLQEVEQAAPPSSPQALTLVELLRFKDNGGEAKYFNEYIAAVQPMFEALGGRTLHVLTGEQVMIGETDIDTVLIVEFPSPQAAAQMTASPEYQAIAHLRAEALEWDQVLPVRNITAMAAMAARQMAAGGQREATAAEAETTAETESAEAKDRSCLEDESHVQILKTAEGIEFVRTPEERFENLPGYPFEPNNAEIDGLRMHYVDEGPKDGEVVLMLHGQPSWSYLYREMIPGIVEAGHRAIAPDMIGLGKSDKPVDWTIHTYEQHVAWTKQFIEALDLKNITLFCQDWGGVIGLRVAGDMPERFARIVVANSTLPVIPPGMNPFQRPESVEIDCSVGDFPPAAMMNAPGQFQRFQAWIDFCLTAPDLTASQVLEWGTATELTAEEEAAYDAPYPSLIYKAGPRALPSMVAGIEDQNLPAWQALGQFERPFLTLFGELDPILGDEAGQNRLTTQVPGAAGQPHERFPANHFIQDDIGETLAERVNAFIEANPVEQPGT